MIRTCSLACSGFWVHLFWFLFSSVWRLYRLQPLCPHALSGVGVHNIMLRRKRPIDDCLVLFNFLVVHVAKWDLKQSWWFTRSSRSPLPNCANTFREHTKGGAIVYERAALGILSVRPQPAALSNSTPLSLSHADEAYFFMSTRNLRNIFWKWIFILPFFACCRSAAAVATAAAHTGLERRWRRTGGALAGFHVPARGGNPVDVQGKPAGSGGRRPPVVCGALRLPGRRRKPAEPKKRFAFNFNLFLWAFLSFNFKQDENAVEKYDLVWKNNLTNWRWKINLLNISDNGNLILTWKWNPSWIYESFKK